MDAPGNLSGDAGQQFPALIASMPASAQQRRIALGVIVFLSVMFVAVIPFARIQAARVDVFIPVVQSIICFADLMTAIFLFSQYSYTSAARSAFSRERLYVQRPVRLSANA